MATTLPITLGATRTLDPVTPLNQTKSQPTAPTIGARKDDSVSLSPQAQAALAKQTSQSSVLDRSNYFQY